MRISTRTSVPATGPGRATSRRTFLFASAVGGAAALLAGCSESGSPDTDATGPAAAPSSSPQPSTPATQPGTPTATSTPGTRTGSAQRPLAVPKTLSESPELAAQVKAGKLPELSKRLPERPYVIPHNWVERGNYGGQLKINITETSGQTVGEYFYGFSPLRFLNDGVTIGPGVAEKWQTNADASTWTFHFRKGLKWSDGKPWTTADIMFWWKYMANYDGYSGESVPDACKSGKGTIAKLVAVDDYTLEIRYDAPAPLTAVKVANGASGYNSFGGSWMVPAHFVKQYHPEFNPKVPKNWSSPGGQWETHCDYKVNPKCPTLTGFRLSKFSDGKSLVWERNPYYYAVSRDGDQLPYIDGITMTVVIDPQVGKLQIGQGKVDYVHGPFNGLQLADVSTLKGSAERSGIDVFLWGSGSGTASMAFCNLDYKEADYRELIRKPKFRQALSLAFNRPQARRAIYFNQGQPTTGTLGPQASEFVDGPAAKQNYVRWRDSFVQYDPERAKKLLDQLGVVDSDGDGFRELPNGKKLELRIDQQADAADEHKQKDNQLVRDWKAVGLSTRVNPVPPNSYGDYWANGTYMIHSDWDASGPPNTLLNNPAWLVPIESSRWAPLQGQMYALRGTPAVHQELDVDPYKRKPPREQPKKGGPVDRLQKLLDAALLEPDDVKRQKLVFQMCKIHATEGPFFQGTVANAPVVEVANSELKNVPRLPDLAHGGMSLPWGYPTPAVYDPEVFFWSAPERHQA